MKQLILWIQAAYFGILPKDNDLKRLTGTNSYDDERPPPYWSN
ncbi:16814_t:CDS:2 [Racocetra fulgida]|uniref:16814_t:CDS:1 n=1 Tax=Racocetra fulgida TaxID=60492 RepID=A0A9N8Z9R2_9GLOM|nr:16814_t:CDS:2 [Racocetra fulgida]